MNYKEYLRSKDWLLKKNKLINIYLEQEWSIDCIICKDTNNLQVHHMHYDNVFSEELDDDQVASLTFLCRDCHKKWHFESGFQDKWISEGMAPIILLMK